MATIDQLSNVSTVLDCESTEGMKLLGDSAESAAAKFNTDGYEDAELQYVCRVGTEYYFNTTLFSQMMQDQVSSGEFTRRVARNYGTAEEMIAPTVPSADQESFEKLRRIQNIMELCGKNDEIKARLGEYEEQIKDCQAEIDRLQGYLKIATSDPDQVEKDVLADIAIHSLSSFLLFGVVTNGALDAGKVAVVFNQTLTNLYYLYSRNAVLKGLCGSVPLAQRQDAGRHFLKTALGASFIGALGWKGLKEVEELWDSTSVEGVLTEQELPSALSDQAIGEFDIPGMTGSVSYDKLEKMSFEELDGIVAKLTRENASLSLKKTKTEKVVKSKQTEQKDTARQILQRVPYEKIDDPDLQQLVVKAGAAEVVFDDSLWAKLGMDPVNVGGIGLGFGLAVHMGTDIWHTWITPKSIKQGMGDIYATAERDAYQIQANGECPEEKIEATEPSQSRVSVGLRPAIPSVESVEDPQTAPTAFSATLPGGMAIPEITIPYEFSPAEFFGRGGGWQLSPAYSVARGGAYFEAGGPPPMEVKVYNMARTMETGAAEAGAPKGSGGAKSPTQGVGTRMGQAAKGVVLYTGGYVLINGAMLYFRTPQELQEYVNGAYGVAGLAAMAKNPALAAYIPSGMLGAEIASDLTYDAIESTNLNAEAKAFAHGTAQVVGGGGAVVGTLYVASRLGMSTPVTALVSGLCLGIYQGYKRHQSLEKARTEFLALAADYEGIPDLFTSLETELPQILNSGFDAGDMERLREIMQSPYYADIMTGMGWYFHERYFKSFINNVLPGIEEFSIGGSPDSPGAGNYASIGKSFGGQLYLLSLEMRCYPAKDVIRAFSKNLKVPMTEANYEAMRAAVRNPKNAEALKEYGPVIVEKLVDLWLGNVGYATGKYSVATWLASSSEQWAKRKEVGVAYGAKVAQLKSWILNPSTLNAEDGQFARMKQSSEVSRVTTLEKNLDKKVTSGEITRAKADQIERDAIMSGVHMPQMSKSRTAAEIEAGQKQYSWMVAEYVDGMTGAFEEDFWSSNCSYEGAMSSKGMVGELVDKMRYLKPDGNVDTGDITPGVFVTMLWRWLDDVQQHLHSREGAGWGQTAIWGGHMDAEEIRAANEALQLLRAKLSEYEKSGDATLLGDSTSHISDSKNTIFGVMGKIDRMVGENSRW